MKDEIKENNSVMKCCICNNENIGEFIVIEDKKYHLNCITNLQEKSNNQAEEINRLYKQREKFMKKYGYLKEENENLKKDIKFYEYSFNKFKERFEKGTEYIKSTKYCGTKIDKISLEEYLNKLLNILNGGDEE